MVLTQTWSSYIHSTCRLPKTHLRAVVLYWRAIPGLHLEKENAPEVILEGLNFKKIPGGMPPDPPTVTCPMIMNPRLNTPTPPYKDICLSEKVSHPQQKNLYETLVSIEYLSASQLLFHLTGYRSRKLKVLACGIIKHLAARTTSMVSFIGKGLERIRRFRGNTHDHSGRQTNQKVHTQ